MEKESKWTMCFADKLWILDLVIEIICFLVVYALVLIAYLGLTPFERGFFCDDQRISYDHHSSTVPTVWLMVWCTVAPIIIIIITEVVCSLINTTFKSKITFFNMIFWSYRLLYGLGLTLFTTLVIKNMAGRLRPDFLSVCQPDYSTIDCTRFVTNYTCQQADLSLVLDSRQSFPSGHTSTAIYSATFVTIYLSLRGSWRRCEFILPILQCTSFLLAAYSAISRIRDNKHHWEDLTVGTILGVLFGISVFRKYVPDLVNGRSEPDTVQMRWTPKKTDVETGDADVVMNRFAESATSVETAMTVN